MRSHARIQHVDAGVGSQRPVVMFTGTVDALERFFMEQAMKALLFRYLFQSLHNQLVVVYRHIALYKDRGQFMLSRSHLIVLRFRRHTKSP